jgi:SNF2 family DNA or RNA helicase
MLIDVSGDTIIINDSCSKLRPDQISQIYFWGFTKAPEDNLYKLSSERIGSILLKILKYFGEERVSYSLLPTSREYLSELNYSINIFEKVKDSGHRYKEGEFDGTKFNEFSSFVKKNICRQLKDHQVKAAFHLYLITNGANFSVPGSGKTAVILSVYEKLKTEGKVNLLFVIGPAACFGPWRGEFKLTLGRIPDWKVLAGGDQVQRKSEYFSPPSQIAELYLTTYQTLLNDQDHLATFLSQRGIKAFMVIDEAHYIKQIDGSWANAVLSISKHAKYRCVLTGTPLPRSYSDVFNLFEFLWPDNSPISSDTKIRIEIHENNNDPESAKKLLKESIGSLFYRVRKSELGLIPPVFHPPFIMQMNKYEKMIYDAIENKIRNYASEDYLRNIDLVRILKRGRITRLRQCVSNVKLLANALENYNETLIDKKSDLMKVIQNYDRLEIPKKLECLTGHIRELHKNRQKLVIWAHFIGTLKLISRYLTDNRFYCKMIYGETPIEQTSIHDEETREKIRDEFVDPNSGLDILIANPGACGESISLHKTCYHAIYYDLSYNCAQYLQSLDRIHRVGGSEINQANYYFLQYENTIDQDIKVNLERKAQKMYDVIEEDYSIYSLDMFEEDDQIEAYERLFGEK